VEAFVAELADAATRVEQKLERILPKPLDDHADLLQAMRYATLTGGKRLRPFLLLECARLFGVAETCALRVAAAVECVHCFRLVHNDLPAMDNDDLRYGGPTVHRKFGEAAAILAGDALLALAFEILAAPETHADPNVRCILIAALARAVGGQGMIGGQALDMVAARERFEIGAVTRLQRLKTGELFAFSCEAGAILGKADSARRQALSHYAHDLGLAFQIADDLLDVEGRQEDGDGGTVAKHNDPDRVTFVSILGEERARAQAIILAEQAVRHLEQFDGRAVNLVKAARFVVERKA
jgi:farnesyl diphosphate synthase